MNSQALLTHMDDIVPLMREQLAAGKSVRFSPKGISMLPMLRQGKDSVVLSPLPEVLRKYDLPLYQRSDGKYILHRIVSVGQTYTCIGDNQYSYEPGVRREQMIALVTSFTRGKREISVEDPLYRLYCRLWHCSRGLRYFLHRVKNRLRRMLK